MDLIYARDRLVRNGATIGFLVCIAVVGWVMMTLTSSPAVKGAALLWLPAALQMIAGVWLGPARGFVAAGAGAQLAGIAAYGGWAPSDWVMNFVAGGIANGMLPGLLFHELRLDPALSPTREATEAPSVWLIVGLVVAVVAIAFLQRPLLEAFHVDGGVTAYAIPLVLVAGAAFLIRGAGSNQFAVAVVLVTVCSFLSASIGVVGAVIGGQTPGAAIVTVGVGWFLGDTVSSIVGLYALAALTPWARLSGFAPLARE